MMMVLSPRNLIFLVILINESGASLGIAWVDVSEGKASLFYKEM